MNKIFLFFANWIVIFALCSQATFGSNNLRNSLANFQYAITVEWDQKDKAFLDEQERILSSEIEKLLLSGESPENILRDCLSLIPDEKTKKEMNEALSLYSNKKMSREELVDFVSMYSNSMQSQGPSWSPVVKFLVGLGIFYVVFNLFLFTLYYWDTDPNYGQVDNNPPKT
jgi:hypothetical protein